MTGIVYWASNPVGKTISFEIQITARGPVTVQSVQAQQYYPTADLTSGAEYFDLASLDSIQFLALPVGVQVILAPSNGGRDQVVIIMETDVPN